MQDITNQPQDVYDFRNDENVDIAMSKHYRPAQMAALAGLSKEQQLQANKDSRTIAYGRLLGALAGGIGGYIFGSQFHTPTSDYDYSLNGLNAAGGAAGAALGAGLGNYITFKLLSKNRGTDDSFAMRHFRAPAQLAALQNLSPKEQKFWNKMDNQFILGDIFGPSGPRRFGSESTINEMRARQLQLGL